MLIDLLYQAAAHPTFVLHGVRKIVQGLSYSTPELPPAPDILKDLGYTKMKVTRLMNIYYNREEVEKAKAKLKQREKEEHTSVSILTRNMEKTHPATQGWCIQNVTISARWKAGQLTTTADVFYRSTELIMKFGADLTLLHNIFDALEVKPSIVRFYFANAYISAVFFPLLFRHTDGVKFLEHIRKNDPAFFFLAGKAISRYLDPVNRYSYRAQVKQRELAQDLDRKLLDQYLLKHFGEYHEVHMPSKRKVIK